MNTDADLFASEMARRRRAAVAAIIPPMFASAAVDPTIRPRVDEWFDRGFAAGDTLVFAGPVGRGKSTAGWATVREAVNRGHSAAGASVSDLAESMRPSSTLRPVDVHADVLLLDDLGRERATDWWLEQLFRIVNDRWANMRATIVTTNLSPEQIADHVGPDITSRLFGIGTVLVELSGPDRRRSC